MREKCILQNTIIRQIGMSFFETYARSLKLRTRPRKISPIHRSYFLDPVHKFDFQQFFDPLMPIEHNNSSTSSGGIINRAVLPTLALILLPILIRCLPCFARAAQ